MVVIVDKERETLVFIPRNLYGRESDTYAVKLVDRGTCNEYDFECVDEHIADYAFYSFRLDCSNLRDGEYEYEVKDDEGNTEATGIIRVSKLNDETIHYNTSEYSELDEIETVVYETEN